MPALRALDALNSVVNRGLAIVAGLALVAMMAFTVADVVLRTLGRPVAGSFEVIGWMSAAAMSLAMGYAQLHRSHVAMTLVSDRLHGRAAALVETIMSLASLALFVAVAWFVTRYGQTLQATGSLSETLRAIVHPWVYVLAIGFAGLALGLMVDSIRSILRVIKPLP